MQPVDTDDAPPNFEARLQQRQQTRTSSLEITPTDSRHAPHDTIPNTPLAAATVSFLLGVSFTVGLVILVPGSRPQNWWATYQLGSFVACWSAFHWLEFAVTAGWNRDKLSIDSFLLVNGLLYHVANGVALSEYLITLYLFPSLKAHPTLSLIGIVLTLGGQVLRSTAMITAASNFSHAIAFRKVQGHTLVSDGIYRYFRHPSYAGFFYWGLGTQIALLNPISFVFFAIVLWSFFHKRIQTEEMLLIKFFGDQYVEYRKRVGTKIPFIA